MKREGEPYGIWCGDVFVGAFRMNPEERGLLHGHLISWLKASRDFGNPREFAGWLSAQGFRRLRDPENPVGAFDEAREWWFKKRPEHICRRLAGAGAKEDLR